MIVLALVSFDAGAQRLFNSSIELDFNPVREVNVNLKKALMPGIFMVQQQYTVVDKTGNEFGANGLDYFGVQYYLGVRLERSILLPQNFTDPGSRDTNYISYKDEYTVRISKIGMRAAADTMPYSNMDLKYFDPEVPAITVDATQQFFKPQSHEGVNEGKLLLFFLENGAGPMDANLAKTSVVDINDIVWDGNKADIKDISYRNMTVIGGVFFNEAVSFGQLSYQPVAFYEKQGNNWFLVSMTGDAAGGKPNSLNPIGGGKGKK